MIRLFAAVAAALFLASAAPPARAADVVAPPLDVRIRTLDNGLKVYAVRDETAPNVSVQVWYDVGSKEDPVGRSGFAHLFEHMLFKATRDMPPEFMDRLTEDVGGFNNASTADDFTNYYEVVPANHLQRILWAEAERMGSLVVDQENFNSEREVVKQELRQRIFASPYGRLFGLYLSQQSFTTHPYGRPGIGNIADLDAATLEDVRAFHEAFYRPDNAHLIVVGNFDPADLDRWVDQYFGPIKRGVRPVPRLSVSEPPRNGAKTVTTYAPNVPLPASVLSYPSPAADNPDAAAIAVLDAILSAGDSSRLYKSLVYDQQVATEVFSFYSPSEEASFIAPGAIAAGGKSVEALETALMAVIADVRDHPVSDAELAEAKTELVASALRERETVDGKGYALGEAILVARDPSYVDRKIADLQAVTVADVQRVARKYMADSQRLAVRYLDESARPEGAPEETPPAGNPVALTIPPATLPPIAAAPEAERVQPPPPGPEQPVPTPRLAERTLANGLRVIVAPSGTLPLASARLVVLAGGGEDPPGRAGVASMTATMMTQGSTRRGAPEIASAAEALGAELSSDAGWDSSALGVSAPSPNLEAAGAILAELATSPAFAPEELERQRSQALDGFEVALRDPGSLAGLVTPNTVFGDAPYGHPLSGTPGSVMAMTTADLTAFHARWWSPRNAALILTGAITPEEGFALAERLFGSWATPLSSDPHRVAARAGPDAAAPRVLVVDLPDSGQSAVVAALRAVDRKDPAYYPLLTANSVLGVGYSSRLNQEIRIKRGLSYGAGSSLSARLDGGVLTASTQTDNPSTATVVGLIRAELERLASEPTPESELTTRKAVLIGQFGRALGTTDGLAGLISSLVAYDLPLSELDRYAPSVRAVGPADLQAAVKAKLAVEAPTLVIVGEASAFLDQLKPAYPNLEVVEADGLDLDAP